MIYLTGSTNNDDEPGLIAAGVGLIANPGNSYHLRLDRFAYWAADNGCFADRWTEAGWLAWLETLPTDRCLFAVAPDVYADAQATIDRSMEYVDLIRALGFPVAFVAQDHAERLALPWDDFDALFLGGEKKDNPRDEWKLSPAAEGLVVEARRRGKWVHMGRVNSMRRIRLARGFGCHSADGTFLKHRLRRKAADEHPDDRRQRGAVEIDGWLRWLRSNPELPRPIEGPSHPAHRRALAG